MPPATSTPGFSDVLAKLAQHSSQLEFDQNWPGDQFELLAAAGILGWVVPREYGGMEVDPIELLVGYELLAGACLTTTFVLTQRNGACQRIAGSDNAELKARLLPRLCSAESFATVGISHLTTSRQHLRQPAVAVEQRAEGFTFSGTVPWVTGANYADWIVTGGTLADGRQILAVVRTGQDGVSIEEPPWLLALNASQTGSVRLDGVLVEEQFVLAGSVEQVMKQGQGGGAGSLTTSALALGAARRSIRTLEDESARRPDLREIADGLNEDRSRAWKDLLTAARGDSPQENACLSAESIRQRANSIVVRSAQACLAASKGAGFVSGHPAERAVRESMFFLVWSCPQPVLTATLREFACVLEP